jgi:cytidylate kinase
MELVQPSRRSPLVTISASYGAGGSVVGPMLADILGLAFCDRMVDSELAGTDAIDAELTGSAAGSVAACGESAHAPELRAVSTASLLGRMAPAWLLDRDFAAPAGFGDREAIRRRSEAEAKQTLHDGGVLLGRAGALVFASQSSAYHVRLDGPRRGRVARAASIEQIDQDDALKRQEQTDRQRAALTRRLYGVDSAEPGPYHLVIDTTPLALEFVAELIAAVAMTFWRTASVDPMPGTSGMCRAWTRSQASTA